LHAVGDVDGREEMGVYGERPEDFGGFGVWWTMYGVVASVLL
jgi:hypothetical protein